MKIGAVDAANIWDAEAKQHEELEIVHVPELDAGKSNMGIAVLTSSKSPNATAALIFARYSRRRTRD